MTTLIARPPLQPLSMSSIQSGSRRHSARLQQKDDAPSDTRGGYSKSEVQPSVKASAKTTNVPNGSKKRKNQYDEEDDGFMFARVKKKKLRSSGVIPEESMPIVATPKKAAESKQEAKERPQKPNNVPTGSAEDQEAPAKKRRNRMSFSTPAPKQQLKVRRSKRLSNEAEPEEASPQPRAKQKDMHLSKMRKQDSESQQNDAKPKIEDDKKSPVSKAPIATESPPEKHSATKIALPFADTPVISRNKAMREGKQKGERRSSLGLRGRRASSLLDSGNSSALPHSEVQIPDFYKHIESDLMEPRRMRLLLTWCATRAMHPKPQGLSFEDASAKSAARVIEEELLKELANKSELSDWFSREDKPAQVAPLPERPNPKNIQNATKISELEEQIKRLRAEKASLDSLQRAPSIPKVENTIQDATKIDRSLLSESDDALLTMLDQSSTTLNDISKRLQSINTNLRPAVDTFADGVHRLSQYRNAADGMAGRILSMCAGKLAYREREGRRKALQSEDDRSPGRDLSSVLRGLSKADR